MTLWILFAVLSMLCYASANTLQDYIAERFKCSSSIVIQYLRTIFLAAIAVILFDTFTLPDPTPLTYVMLAAMGVIGYLGVRTFMKSLKYLDAAPALLIIYQYVIFGYIVNILLLDTQETFSVAKLILGGGFFLIVAKFLFLGKTHHNHLRFDRRYLRPLASALLLTIFFSSINRLIKTDQLYPFQSVFYTEGAIFLIALVTYLLKKHDRKKITHLHTKALPTFSRAVFNVCWSIFAYLAYEQIAANSVHVIRLFGVMLTTLLAWMFLKEQLTRQQLLRIGLAVGVLIAFTLVE